jgi:hypothetical protein
MAALITHKFVGKIFSMEIFFQLINYDYATFSRLSAAWDVASHEEFHEKKMPRLVKHN